MRRREGRRRPRRRSTRPGPWRRSRDRPLRRASTRRRGENRPPLAVNQRAKARSKAVGNEDEDEDQDGSEPETEGGTSAAGEDADAVGNIIGEDAHTNANIANARNAQDARERRAMATDDDQHEDDRDGVGVPTPSMRTTKSRLSSTLGSKPTLSLCVFRLSVLVASPHHQPTPPNPP